MEIQKVDEPKQLTVTDYSSLERKKWVTSQILVGRYAYDIRQEYMKTYQLSEHSYEKDVTWAYTQIKAYGDRSAERVIEDHSNYLLDVYRHCRESGDNSNAIKALKERRELLGIGGTKTKSISLNQTINNTTQLPAMSVEEIRKLLGKSSTGNEIIDITPTG